MVVRTTARVVEVQNITPKVFNLVLSPEKRIIFKSGQYVILQTTVEGQPVRRSYSIASKEDEEHIILTIKNVKGGKVSPHLKNLKADDEVVLLGPAGHFVLRESNKNELFIGSGTGVAPLRSMIFSSNNNRVLISGHQKSEDILYKKEFEKLAEENEKFKFFYCTSKEESEGGFKGYVQDNLSKIITGTDYECYVCGLKEMVFSTIKKLEELGIPRHQIHFERYN